MQVSEHAAKLPLDASPLVRLRVGAPSSNGRAADAPLYMHASRLRTQFYAPGRPSLAPPGCDEQRAAMTRPKTSCSPLPSIASTLRPWLPTRGARRFTRPKCMRLGPWVGVASARIRSRRYGADRLDIDDGRICRAAHAPCFAPVLFGLAC